MADDGTAERLADPPATAPAGAAGAAGAPARPTFLSPDAFGTVPTSAKGRRTRERLLRAARTVFERDGFLAARIADIAAEAEVAHGTFYTYFDSKPQVFRIIVADVMAKVYDTNAGTAAGCAGGTGGAEEAGGGPPADRTGGLTPRQRIERGNRRFVQVFRENAAMLAQMEQMISHDDEVRDLRLVVRQVSVERIRRSILRWRAQGLVRTDLDPLAAASALVSMVSNFSHFWIVMGEGDYGEDQAVHTLTSLWASALELKD